MTLEQYLEAALALPWGYGGVDCQDCTIFAADWCKALTGTDPAADLRGTYSNETEAVTIVRGAGGMIPFIGGRLTGAGWSRVQVPEDGDIGVVKAPIPPQGSFGLIPAIRQGGLWTCRAKKGQGTRDFECRAIWRAA